MSMLYLLNATELRQRLREKAITPSDIAASCLQRCKEVEPYIGAWAYLEEESIERQLEKISAYDADEHPMWGIPVGVKDIFNTFDMPTEMGSVIWKDFTPGNDARIVHYLRRNGAILLGKTVTAEFAVHHQEHTHNPHDLDRAPGTSSSGSAAAVASGMVPVALGSQTAGSIGRPASYCGVYGFKPSFGVLSRIGVLKTTDTLDTLGFFTRSVDDLEMVFDATRVHGENYEFVHRYIDSYCSDPNRTYRVGIIEHPQWKHAGESEKEAFAAWTESLSVGSISVEHLECPEYLADIYALHDTIYDRSLAYYFKDEMPEKEKMSARFTAMIEHGQSITLQDYQQALEQQEQISHRFDAWMNDYDILLTLGTAGEAPLGIDAVEPPDSNLIWTFLGVPSLMMPVLKGPNGLPVGILCIARKYCDLQLIEFSQLLKKHGLINDILPVTPKDEEGLMNE